ncbi:MAG: DUF3656 domain-containing protein [Eubacteriales bacterium]|nr:DUF3656 domain-containing protein [Eubacteriales bacterium]
MRQMIEILAPAGDYETLKAAVAAGADAVYVGGERFGARAYAKNFSNEELLSAIDYIHLHGRKLYLTVNTLVKEREFADLYDYLQPFYQQGLDAVIVQDVGVMDFVRRQFPGLPIHASTQMTVTNVISAKYLESVGVERVVPARELSLKEIQKIRQDTDLEIECFVHGALCYCYSGQCLLSSMIGGRSGNRGQCAQPCRLPYKVGDNRASDILSLKDLCTIEAIPNLIESGITSFKIEGRMKQPGYVATVTGLYRKYVDLYRQCGRKGFRVSKSDRAKLENAYQRRGYCDGYYYKHNGREMLSLERPKQEHNPEKIQDTECQEKINGKLILSPGKHAKLYLQYGEIWQEVTGGIAERAAKQPITRERVEKQMRKTGNTPFVFDQLDIFIDEEVFVPIQTLNELRRQGLEALEKRIVQQYRRKPGRRIPDPDLCSSCSLKKQDEMRLTAAVESLEQLEVVTANPCVSRIYVEDALWEARESREAVKELVLAAKAAEKQVYFSMARIFRQEAKQIYDRHFAELAECFDGVLVRNLESYLYVREFRKEIPSVTDSSVYQWNLYSKRWWEEMGIEAATAPVELNRWELQELGIQNMEMIVYGYLPVMVSAGCVKKNTRGCDRHSGFLTMRDRQDRKNTVKNECSYCYNVIYNSAPLMLHNQYKELCSLQPKALRLQFTVEDKKRTKEILKLFTALYLEGQIDSVPDMEFTKGHFKRGVK